MRSAESALFKATAVPAGLFALAVTAWLAKTHAAALAPGMPILGLLTLAAVLSWHLSFSTEGRGKVSLELAYFIAAALMLPFPAPLLVGALTALIGSILRVGRDLSTVRFASLTGANVTIATAMTGAASAVQALVAPYLPSAEHAILHPLVLAAASFVAMNAVNLALMAAWVTARGESPSLWAQYF